MYSTTDLFRPNEDYFARMSAILEDKPSLEDVQNARKARYIDRQSRPKYVERKKIRKPVASETESDDEMPEPKPKIRKKSTKPKKIVDVITLNGKGDVIDIRKSSDEVPKVGGPSENKEKKEPTGYKSTPKSRISPQNSKEEALFEEFQKKNAERKAIRLEMEKRMEKEETQRKRDRERKRKRAMEKNGITVDEKSLKEKNRILDEKMKRNREKPGKMTDPSLDPSTISLETPEIIPWAKRQKKKKGAESEEKWAEPPEMTSLDSLIESFDMNDVLGNSPVYLPNLLSNPTTPTFSDDVSPDDVTEALPIILEETENFFTIPDSQIDCLEKIDDNFLQIINDDSILIDPVAAFNTF